jgi:hypothetical protein
MNNVEPGELWYESSIHYENSFLNFAISNCDVRSDSDRKNILSISLDLKTGKISYNIMLSNEAFTYSSTRLT